MIRTITRDHSVDPGGETKDRGEISVSLDNEKEEVIGLNGTLCNYESKKIDWRWKVIGNLFHT